MSLPGHPNAISRKSEPSPGPWKGIVLAGGSGTRLYPTTRAVSKPLLPVYDKPMIYYPLSVLMQAGIRDILVITTPKDLPRFHALLEDGSQWGVQFSYVEQPRPAGIPDAFIIGREFIGDDRVCLILSDNIFHGDGLEAILRRALRLESGGLVFAYWVHDPHRYGVMEFDDLGRVIGIEEKPAAPKSNFAVTGLYLFDSRVVEIAARLVPSKRGELEIIDVVKEYLELEELRVELLGGEITWMDVGTYESLAEAGAFVEINEERRGVKVGCLEEVAYKMGFIGPEQVRRLAEPLCKNDYGRYLLQLLGSPAQ